MSNIRFRIIASFKKKVGILVNNCYIHRTQLLVLKLLADIVIGISVQSNC